jgi:zona occludens toxin
MINLLLGAPGAGKSYEAVVYHVLPAVEEGRKVVTNLPLDIDEIAKIHPRARTLIRILEPTKQNPRPFSRVEDYQDPWRDPETCRGVLYIVDECHMVLPRGRTPVDVEEWFALHRHEGADVLLVTQSYGKVSKNILDLVQVCYRLRKATMLGFSGRYIRKVLDGLRGAEMSTDIRVYRSQYFKLYKSHTRTQGSVSESGARDLRPIWRHWSIYAFVPFFLLATYLILSGKANPFGLLSGSSKASSPSVVAITEAESEPLPLLFVLPYSHDVDSVPVPPSPVAGLELNLVPQYGSLESLDGVSVPPLPRHPYSGIQLAIEGSIESSSGRHRVYFVAYNNGQISHRTTSDELEGAGYVYYRLSPCLVQLEWRGRFADYVTCSTPGAVPGAVSK